MLLVSGEMSVIYFLPSEWQIRFPAVTKPHIYMSNIKLFPLLYASIVIVHVYHLFHSFDFIVTHLSWVNCCEGTFELLLSNYSDVFV